MSLRPLLLAAVLAVSLLAAPAAEAAGGPKARADAQRLAKLYYAFDRALTRAGERFEDGIDEDLESCAAAPPETDVDETFVYRIASIYLRSLIARTDRRFASIVVKLETFRTRDRTVRRAARRIASSLTLIRALGTSPPGLCPYLEAWEAAGWTADFRISPPARNFTPEELTILREDARVVRRSVRRLRALGVSRKRLAPMLDLFSGTGEFGKLAI